jgi:hypothetical protein
MSGKSPVSASEDTRSALAVLAGSRDRDEATEHELWRSDFSCDDTEALKTSVAPGLSQVRVKRALRTVGSLMEEPVADRPNWRIARMRAEVEAREGARISRSQRSKALRKKVPYRRPRHT